MDYINDGVDKITSLKSRELERRINLQKKQDCKKSGLAENEQLDFFERTFTEKQCFIENLIKNCLNLPKNELPDHFNTITKEILLLQKYVAASSLFLRNYFLQKCQNTIQELGNRSRELENELLPKKKFGFKNKPKIREEEKVTNGSKADEVDFAAKKDKANNRTNGANTFPTIDCGFYKRKDQTLRLNPDDIYKKDVSLENLSNCKVFLTGIPSTLHLNHLSNCQIFTGPVSTSIFAENCYDCTFVIACQQLRLHASKHVDIFLHVTSRAIMEDCDRIEIAPYNWSYDIIERDFREAGLDLSVNNWRCIDDFNWLNAEKHSPNWREMDEEKRMDLSFC